MAQLSFWQDIRYLPLLPFKVVVFLRAACFGALIPFIALHMRSLALSPKSIGIATGAACAVSLLIVPIIGAAVDRIRNQKFTMALFFIGIGLFANGFLLVPKVASLKESCSRAVVSTRVWPEVIHSSTALIDDLDIALDSVAEVDVLKSSEILENDLLIKAKYKHKSENGGGAKNRAQLRDKHDQVINQAELSLVREKPRAEPPPVEMRCNCSAGRKEMFICRGKTCCDADKFDNIEMTNCPIAPCDVYCSGQTPAPGRFCQIDTNYGLYAITFFTYLLLRVSYEVSLKSDGGLVPAVIERVTRFHQSRYGFQYLWHPLGVTCGGLLSGVLSDHFSTEEKKTYAPGYLFAGVIFTFLSVFIFCLDFKNPDEEPEKPENEKAPTPEKQESLFQSLASLFQHPHVVVFFLIVLIEGSLSSSRDVFIPLFLDNLGASSTYMSVSVAIRNITGVIICSRASQFIQKVGHIPAMSLCIFIHAIRLGVLPIIPSVYYDLGLEVMEGLRHDLFIVVSTEYANRMLPGGQLQVTVQSIRNALYFGGGNVAGGFIGGFLVASVGFRWYFVCLCATAVATSTAYMLFHGCSSAYNRHANGKNGEVIAAAPAAEYHLTNGDEPAESKRLV